MTTSSHCDACAGSDDCSNGRGWRAPGHGELIRDPERAVDWIIAHRLEREAKVVAAIRDNPQLTTHELVPHVYRDVNQKLFGLAERSLMAHLEKLVLDKRVVFADGRWTLNDS